MAETLEIQIQDKGGIGPAGGPPRAPGRPSDLRPNAALDEVFGVTPKAPAVAKKEEDIFAKEMGKAAGEEMAKDILPALEDLGIRQENPISKAARAQHEQYKQAKFQNYTSETEAPPIRIGSAAEAAEGGEMAGGLEAAGAGLAEVAAVAAPVAVGLAAVYAAVKLTEAAFNAVGAAAQVAGQQLSMIAKNNYVGALNAGMETATKAVSKIPVVGGLLGSAFGAATASVKAFTSVTEAFTQRAHELAGFNPAIMMAEQRQTMRSLMDDIKEANQLGPGFERMLDAETNLQHDLREMFLPVKKIIVEVLADVLEKIRESLPEIAKGVAALLDGTSAMIALLDNLTLHVLHGLAEPAEKLLEQVAESLRKIKANTDPKQEINDIFLNDLFAERDWNFNGGDPWAGIEGNPRPNIPIVAGFGGL